MTTDSETTEQYLTFVWSRFLISVCPSFCVTRLQTWKGLNSVYAFAIVIIFTRWLLAFRCDRQTHTELIFLYIIHDEDRPKGNTMELLKARNYSVVQSTI